jgi:hypothetical protein
VQCVGFVIVDKAKFSEHSDSKRNVTKLYVLEKNLDAPFGYEMREEAHVSSFNGSSDRQVIMDVCTCPFLEDPLSCSNFKASQGTDKKVV